MVAVPKRSSVSSSASSVCLLAVTVTVLMLHLLVPVSVATVQTVSNRQMLRKMFNCPSCDQASCPPLQEQCQTVLEPGVCACCQVCAKLAGESCGLPSGRCAKGLTCRPRPDDPDPLGAIVAGTAVCV